MNTRPPLFTRAELAEEMRMSEAALWNLIPRVPGFTYMKAGRRVLIDEHNIRLLKTHLEARALLETPSTAAPTFLPVGDPVLPQVYRALWKVAIRGAVKRKIDFKLTEFEYRTIVERAAGHCEVSGIKFDSTKGHKSNWRPFAPSLDRIDSKQCYMMENCRLVCCAVNVAMGSWGEDVLWRIATAMMAKGRRNA